MTSGAPADEEPAPDVSDPWRLKCTRRRFVRHGLDDLIGIICAENLNSGLDPSTARRNGFGKSLVEGKSVRFREILQLREVDLIEQLPERVMTDCKPPAKQLSLEFRNIDAML